MNWLTWALLSALFAGMTAVLAKVGVAGVDSNLATAVRTTVVLVFAWGVALATSPLAEVTTLPRRTWLFLALSGVATGLSWLCYFRALQLGPASKVAPIDKLSVVFVLVFAAGFLGEPLTWKTLVGGALIAGGAVLLALR
jgi:transporter family protein